MCFKFDILDKGEDVPVDLKSLEVQMVFYVKMDLTIRERLVMDGHSHDD